MTMTRGLEGIVATTSAISSIRDDVLTYRGYRIQDLAEQTTFEEVIYLLWNGDLPTSEQLSVFRKSLAADAAVPDELFAMMKMFPLDQVHPMAVLRSSVSNLGIYDTDAERAGIEANQTKAIRLQAKVATLVAGFSRIRQGLDPVSPDPSKHFAENFLYMMRGKAPSDLEARLLDRALILHADHELNASTFTARVCVATLSDIYSGITAAIGALKGPLHGGANEQVMHMLEEIGSIDWVDDYIYEALAVKKKIMGFGHRVYKNGDPRARILKDMARQISELHEDTRLYEMSLRIEQIMKEKKGLLPNTDFYSATLYHLLGIDHDLFTPVFAVSRTSGWAAHIMEQYKDNRLIRPRAEYNGPHLRRVIPIDLR
ncbi:citrate synthase [Sporolactobacillus inulinus]|uniref:Citrate synthase n=2 Tax=Sporolactobacillus inulinus TaxID=2078 RepID=A0A0U1QKV4_9BACL|nr:citrate synthase [Sporolactobacillus inulinus]KLI01450.1 citrate synthase [Sporolactobacillus inulinus CASD]GEB75705.1 citrate synthase 2 [Sporolactobacillus inulinus]